MYPISDNPGYASCSFTAVGANKAKLKAAIKTGVGEKLEAKKDVLSVLNSIVDLAEEVNVGSVFSMDINVQYQGDDLVYFNVRLGTQTSTFA